jgi:hypothetical protein
MTRVGSLAPHMKIDGLDWLDWLHKVRREAEEKRIQDGLTVEQWLGEVSRRSADRRAIRRSGQPAPVVRDKKP